MAKWVEGKEFTASCPCSAIAPPDCAAEEEGVEQVEQMEQVEDVFEGPVDAEQCAACTAACCSAPAVRMLEGEKVPYSESCRSSQFIKLSNAMDHVCRDPKLEAAVSKGLLKRKMKRSSDSEVQTTGDYFNPYLSCFNMRKSCNMSGAAWDKMRLWAIDYTRRGGNLLELPTSRALNKYREEMVPEGLLVSTTTGRIPLESTLSHTARRMCQRPDMQDSLDLLEDGSVLEMLWKWGMDFWEA